MAPIIADISKSLYITSCCHRFRDMWCHIKPTNPMLPTKLIAIDTSIVEVINWISFMFSKYVSLSQSLQGHQDRYFHFWYNKK